MREVVVTAVLNAPRAVIEEYLSPRSIVEYAGTYEVESVEEREGKTLVRAGTDQFGIALEFTKLSDGYQYTQREDVGPFEEMHTWVTLEDGAETSGPEEAVSIPGLKSDERTVIRVRSVYTFGGRLSRFKDWVAAGDRRAELERLVGFLVDDLTEEYQSDRTAIDSNSADRTSIDSTSVDSTSVDSNSGEPTEGTCGATDSEFHETPDD